MSIMIDRTCRDGRPSPALTCWGAVSTQGGTVSTQGGAVKDRTCRDGRPSRAQRLRRRHRRRRRGRRCAIASSSTPFSRCTRVGSCRSARMGSPQPPSRRACAGSFRSSSLLGTLLSERLWSPRGFRAATAAVTAPGPMGAPLPTSAPGLHGLNPDCTHPRRDCMCGDPRHMCFRPQARSCPLPSWVL